MKQDKLKVYINLESIQEPEDKNKKETHVTQVPNQTNEIAATSPALLL